MSDNYRALTRTYRPATFDDIVSQEHVSSTLKNAISQNRLAHAYMFCGPRGVGKTTMARVLARTVNNVEETVDGESLQQTLNIIEIDAASNRKVGDVEQLRETVRIPPQNGRYKIFIIDEVHMLSKTAFNALLKTLEEPPDHIIFIFATTEPNKVLPTILSRVQRFDFKRIGIEDIVSHLNKVADDENISIDNESLHVIAKKADGALRDALGLLDQAIAFCGSDIQHKELLQALNVVSTERMFDFMDAVEQQDASRGLELINELLHEGYDIQEYLVGLTEHIRNLYVAHKSDKMHLVEASRETKKRYQEAAKTFSENDLMRMLHLVSEAQYKIKEAHQPKIQFEITLLKLIHMERSQDLNTLISELRLLKKKLSNQSGLTTASDSASDDDTDIKNSDDPTPDVNGKEETSAELPDEQDDTDTQSTEEEATSISSDETVPTSEKPVSEPAATTAAVAEARAGEEDFDQLFGTSSLGRKKRSDSSKTAEPQQPKEKKSTRAPKEVSLDEINDHWDDFIDLLRQDVPQMLYFQMQRLKPISLKNGDLLLRCNDDFAQKIVEENKRQLGQILAQGIGAFLNISCKVQKDKSNSEQSMSPYERFKKLQKRDPTIKTLVELFGAELDYNLNR